MKQSWLPPFSFNISLNNTSFHISINSIGLYLSPESFMHFLSNFYIQPCVGKTFKFMELTFLENALIWGIFTHASPHSKLAREFLSPHPRLKKNTQSPKAGFFQKSVSHNCRKEWRNYDLLFSQKYEDDLERKDFYILYDLQFFKNVMALQFYK